MKIAVLGNGSIGLTSALSLSDAGHKVYLFGDRNKTGSASKAAGAMLNVMAEMEDNQLDFTPSKKKFYLAYNSQKKWKGFIKKNFSPKEFRSYNKRFTLVFRNNFTTPFEENQFKYLKSHLNSFPNDIKLNYRKLKTNNYKSVKELIHLPEEKYIDSRLLLSRLDNLLIKNKVKMVFDKKIYKLKKRNHKIEIKYQNKTEIFDYVVIALGSYTQKFNEINRKLVGKIPKIFFGTGTAFRVKKKNFTPKFIKSDYVLRTMNRGNACGFHLVPLNNNEYYFGASNSVSQIEEKKSRIGSVAVLTNGLINEFDPYLSDNHIELCIGHRPTSADTYPILGPLNDHPQILYATGNKRDGLTCSVEISKLIKEYIEGDRTSFENYHLFKPNRKLISFYNKDIAIKKASEASVAGFIMHNGKKYINDWDKLVKIEKSNIQKIYKNIGSKEFGIHPELISLYRNKRI